MSSPIYGGRYYALRQEKVEPRRRQAETYGKSSARVKPLAESTLPAHIVIESRLLTWEEWLAIQDRLKANKLQAMRNANRDYLLRSIIFCDTHRRRYHGVPRDGQWGYACSATSESGLGPCSAPRLSGPKLEGEVKALCRKVLGSPEIMERELHNWQGAVKATMESLRKGLAALDRKHERNLQTETNLLLEKARGDASPEAYERAMARLRAEGAWIAEERQRLQGQLETAWKGEAVLLGLAQARERLAAKLDSASNDGWRLVFNGVALEVHVTEQGETEVALAIPMEETPIVSHTLGHPPAPRTRRRGRYPWRRQWLLPG